MRVVHLALGALFAVASALQPGVRVRSAVRTRTVLRVSMCAVETTEPKADATGTPMYGVYLYNDNYNMREYVSRVLMMVATISEMDAADSMMQANWNGRALVGTWEEVIAQHVYDGLTQAGLQAAIQQIDEEEEGGWQSTGRAWNLD